MTPEAISMHPSTPDWTDVARDIGGTFAARAAQHDRDGAFVANNYADLRNLRLFSAGIPAELGGGGASHAEVCAIVRELGRARVCLYSEIPPGKVRSWFMHPLRDWAEVERLMEDAGTVSVLPQAASILAEVAAPVGER